MPPAERKLTVSQTEEVADHLLAEHLKNNPRLVDKGFCLSYAHLSTRRKFIRTLWLAMAFAPVGTFGLIKFSELLDPAAEKAWQLIAVIAIFAITTPWAAIVMYRKWQTEAEAPP